MKPTVNERRRLERCMPPRVKSDHSAINRSEADFLFHSQDASRLYRNEPKPIPRKLSLIQLKVVY